MARVLATLAVALPCAGCAGCASGVNDVAHPMKVQTRTDAGEFVADAHCKMSDDRGVFSVESGEAVQARRSSKDLEIVCKHPTNPDANGKAISRADAGMWGNIVLGGGVGAIIDHNKGTGSTYPFGCSGSSAGHWPSAAVPTSKGCQTSPRRASPRPGNDPMRTLRSSAQSPLGLIHRRRQDRAREAYRSQPIDLASIPQDDRTGRARRLLFDRSQSRISALTPRPSPAPSPAPVR
jgi:hypothetical protein